MSIHVNWSRLDLGGLYPEGSAEAVAVIRKFVEALDTELAKVVAWVAQSSAWLLNQINFLEELVGALLDLMRALIEIFTGTSVSITYWVPESLRRTLSPRQVLARVAQSYTDRTDPQRPIALTSETAFCAFVIFVTGPSPRDLLIQIEALQRLFGTPMVIGRQRVRSMFDPIGGEYPPKVFPGRGQTPNWATKRLADMGAIGEFVQALISIEQAVQRGRNNVELIRRMLELLNERSSRILAILERAERALQTMAEVLVTTTGLQTLQVSGYGSTPEQVAGMLTATAVEDYPFSDKEATAVLVLHAQAGSALQIAAFLNVFGLRLADGVEFPVPPRNPTVPPRQPVLPENTIRNPWSRG